jgi:hypothetical protein
MAKLVARPLATAAVRIKTFLKNHKWTTVRKEVANTLFPAKKIYKKATLSLSTLSKKLYQGQKKIWQNADSKP